MEAPSLEGHKAAGQRAEKECEEQSARAGGGTGDLTGRGLRTSMTRQDVFHQAPTGASQEHRPHHTQPPPPPPAIVLSQNATQEASPFTSRDPPRLLAASESCENNVSLWTWRVHTLRQKRSFEGGILAPAQVP